MLSIITGSHRIRFKDDTRVKKGSLIPSTGAPFVIVGSRLLECHQGPDHRKQANESTNELNVKRSKWRIRGWWRWRNVWWWCRSYAVGVIIESNSRLWTDVLPLGIGGNQGNGNDDGPPKR
ncbi:hypothetical protein DPMN_058027 [Dreissena polymorpha]|uniref:Uncharacterized protein n=1 Tax=Dreissena polymorpha TaxID=45954 RepID=A0A9D4C194_DREPO|nr:hypothetical protein DPMN_058027 [Dreissena polymorpha]